MSQQEPFSRPQRTVAIYGMICFILVLVVCQIWLITATVQAFLGGDNTVVWAAGIASLFCLGLNVGLLGYLHKLAPPQ